jgi:hypothetical protein
LIGKFAHSKNAVGEEHLHVRHGVQSSPEMATVVYERVRDATAKNMGECDKHETAMLRTVFFLRRREGRSL